MAKSKIEWTDMTWNAITGCSKTSPGCDKCYAERMSKRLAGRYGYSRDDPFTVTYHQDKLAEPLSWRIPRRVFVCSMGDLFHDDVENWMLDEIFGIMLACQVFENLPRHAFILCTKRARRMHQYLSSEPKELLQRWSRAVDGVAIPWGEMSFSELVEAQCSALWDERGAARTKLRSWGYTENLFPLKNVIGMVTAENQPLADERIYWLTESPFRCRGVSVEPMLGPVDLVRWLKPFVDLPSCMSGDGPTYREKIDWVICGGETGPGARPMNPDWVRALRDQCRTADVPFFFKSFGEWISLPAIDPHIKSSPVITLEGKRMCRVGKKSAGRILDGQVWDECPRL